MGTETTAVAARCRLEEWSAQIMDCQNRPKGMRVVEWCSDHGITKANYYYRLHRVREACLQAFPQEMTAPDIAKVNPDFLQQSARGDGCTLRGLSISVNGLSIQVEEETSMALLASVLEVVRNA